MADPITEIRIHELEQKLALMPGSRAFVALAEEYRRAGRLEQALATLTKGLETHPNYLSAQVAIARLYQEMGKLPESIAAFQKVLAADRQNLVAAKSLADLYRSQGEPLEALKKYKLYRALSADPDTDEQIAELERELNAPPGGFVQSAARVPPAPAAGIFTEAPPLERPAAEPIPEPFLLEEPAPEAPAPAGGLVEELMAFPAPSPSVDAPSTPALAGEGAPPAGIPASRTLADLYYDQGHSEDARRIYERLARANPEDQSLAQRLKQLTDGQAESRPARGGSGEGRQRRVAALQAWLRRVASRPARA